MTNDHQINRPANKSLASPLVAAANSLNQSYSNVGPTSPMSIKTTKYRSPSANSLNASKESNHSPSPRGNLFHLYSSFN